MRGLLMDVCGLMLGVGMPNEQKNADAWDMEGRTESTVPSVAIVYIGGEKRMRARSRQEHTGLDGGSCSVGGGSASKVEEVGPTRDLDKDLPTRKVVVIIITPVVLVLVQGLLRPLLLTLGLGVVCISAS